MSNFYWYDNDNLDYGGIATGKIDSSVHHHTDWDIISLIIQRTANTNSGREAGPSGSMAIVTAEA